jgi:hypothetical protein
LGPAGEVAARKGAASLGRWLFVLREREPRSGHRTIHLTPPSESDAEADHFACLARFARRGEQLMPRQAVTCTRVYRDHVGALQQCDGPMTFCRWSNMWTCTWCGLVLAHVPLRAVRDDCEARSRARAPAAAVSRPRGG